MSVWIIEPRDPLIVRDGRPFGPNPGVRARSLPMPFPSTIAGGVRTRAGVDENGRFDENSIPLVKQIQVRGPLLAKLEGDGTPHYLVSAPADALLFANDSSQTADRKWLQPLAVPAGAQTNLPSLLALPVGLPQPDLRKPSKLAPAYWHWEQFAQWLQTPTDGDVTLATLGLNGPEADRRVHVAIDPSTLTGVEGALFMTSGRTFTHNTQPENPALNTVERLALVTAVDKLDQQLTLQAGFAPLGGERRLVHWQQSNAPLPACPESIIETVAAQKHCRIILLTPAVFTKGWEPTWLLQPQHNVTPTLKAAAVGKPQTVSGWNFEAGKRGPKPTRRLAAAGSVYFLELAGEEADIKQWLQKIWFQCVSDDAEDRLTGFGVTAVGTWSGTPQPITLSEENNA